MLPLIIKAIRAFINKLKNHVSCRLRNQKPVGDTIALITASVLLNLVYFFLYFQSKAMVLVNHTSTKLLEKPLLTKKKKKSPDTYFFHKFRKDVVENIDIVENNKAIRMLSFNL